MRPGTMPTKRKWIDEPKEAMAQRLAECIEECIGESTLVECKCMTRGGIINNLRDLGLKGRTKIFTDTEAKKAAVRAEKEAVRVEKEAVRAEKPAVCEQRKQRRRQRKQRRKQQ